MKSRPVWAKSLLRSDWQHLRDVHDKPLLRHLREDAAAGNCDTCKRIYLYVCHVRGKMA